VTGGSAGAPISKQRIIKIHEEMLIKITKNGAILRPETFKFYSQKVMRKQLYDVHIYRT
jgi:3-polyprenyl-4-hydroxybenzoate decarboxylase